MVSFRASNGRSDACRDGPDAILLLPSARERGNLCRIMKTMMQTEQRDGGRGPRMMSSDDANDNNCAPSIPGPAARKFI